MKRDCFHYIHHKTYSFCYNDFGKFLNLIFNGIFMILGLGSLIIRNEICYTEKQPNIL